MTREPEKLSRKELAALVSELRGEEVSVKMILRNEARWGLREARGTDLNRRVVRYDRTLSLLALRKNKVIPE
jgi:hypothetical protein